VCAKTYGGSNEAYYVWTEQGERLGCVYLNFDDALNYDDVAPDEFQPAVLINEDLPEEQRDAVITQCIEAARKHQMWTCDHPRNQFTYVLATDEWFTDTFPRQLSENSRDHALIRSLMELCGDDLNQLRAVVERSSYSGKKKKECAPEPANSKQMQEYRPAHLME